METLEQIDALVKVAKNDLDQGKLGSAEIITQIAIAEYLGKIAAALELYVAAH